MNKGCLGIGVILSAIGVLAIIWGWTTYNNLVKENDNAAKAWDKVESEYQKRYDLIGNLVATIDNAAEFEKENLTNVSEARSKASSIKLTAEELTEENLNNFQQAQTELNESFLVTMSFLQENYPQLTTTEDFLDLSTQIKETENKINVSIHYYNDAINQYNSKVINAPNNIIASIFGFERKASFSLPTNAKKDSHISNETNP